MSEFQAHVLAFICCVLAMFGVMISIKLLGGSREAIACVIPLFVCISGWVTGMVVVHYPGDSRREGHDAHR